MAAARHVHVLGARAARDRRCGVAAAPAALAVAARRDRSDRDDRRGGDLRPATLPDRGGTRDPRPRRGHPGRARRRARPFGGTVTFRAFQWVGETKTTKPSPIA